MTEHVVSRELASDERALLARVLRDATFPGATELAGQLEHVRVAGGIPTLLDLEVTRTAPRSIVTDGPIPRRAFVEGADGKTDGEILVWTKDGYLDSLEYAWYTDEPPQALPPSPARVRIE